jgi:hypothetical protein
MAANAAVMIIMAKSGARSAISIEPSPFIVSLRTQYPRGRRFAMTPGIRFHKFGWSFPAAGRWLPVLTVEGVLPDVTVCLWAAETRKDTDQSRMRSRKKTPSPHLRKGAPCTLPLGYIRAVKQPSTLRNRRPSPQSVGVYDFHAGEMSEGRNYPCPSFSPCRILQIPRSAGVFCPSRTGNRVNF